MPSKRKQPVPALQEFKIKLKRCDSSTPSLQSLTCSGDSPKVLGDEKQCKVTNESLDLVKVGKPFGVSKLHKMISRSRGTAIECLMPSPTRKTRHFKSRDRGQNWRVTETGDLKELRANQLKGKESESRSDSRPKSKKSVNSSDGLEVNDFDNFNRFDFCDEDSMSLSDEENEETDDFRSVGQPLDPSIRSTRIPLKLCFSVLAIFVSFFVYKHYNDLEVFLNVYKSKT